MLSLSANFELDNWKFFDLSLILVIDKSLQT